MSNENRIVSPVFSRLAAVLLCAFLSLTQTAAAAEDMPGNANDFRKLLEAAGWKSISGPDGATYLYPAEHPYAYLVPPSNGVWSDIPPPGSKTLSAIVNWLELQGYSPIVEIEFEDGLWEVEAYRFGQLVEFEIDPVTGGSKGVPEDND